MEFGKKTKKIGSGKEEVVVEQEHKDGHIPEKIEYEMSDIMKDLLNFSAKYLKIGGRLVYWLPVVRPEYVEENVPRHPCLKVIANSEQGLSTHIGRRLITMEKTKDVQENGLCEATLAEDLYGGDSFRNKYFKIPRSRSVSPQRLHGHEESGDEKSRDLSNLDMQSMKQELGNIAVNQLNSAKAHESETGDLNQSALSAKS